MKTPREKYQNDPTYKSLVDALVQHIMAARVTPSEVREAALLACIIYEESKPFSIAFPSDVLKWLDTPTEIRG